MGHEKFKKLYKRQDPISQYLEKSCPVRDPS